MLDLSPLWISLKVALPATIFTFVLGICAARTVVKRTGCPRRPVHSAFSSAPNRRRFFPAAGFREKQPGGTVLFPVWVFLYIFLAGGGHRLHCRLISADVPHGPRRL